MLVDSHIHLDLKVYSDDLTEVIDRAKRSGIDEFIVPGTSIESSKKCVELATEYSDVYAAVGVHPHEADKAEENYPELIKELSNSDKVVAIGEIGLDFNKNYSSVEVQLGIFDSQIKIGKELDLPMIIHNRDSDNKMESILRSNDYYNGVIHCYTGGLNFAKTLISMGFYLGFTGIVTFGNEILEDVIRKIPNEKLLVETDGPYMTPVPHRGKRNEPAFVKYVAEKIAEIKGMTIEELSDQTTNNCHTLFKRMNDGR